jgi:polyphenol oxidase
MDWTTAESPKGYSHSRIPCWQHNPRAGADVRVPGPATPVSQANCDYTDKAVAIAKTSPSKRRNRKQPKARAAEKPWTERVLRGVRVLQVPALSEIPWLVHGFSTRPGGASDSHGEKVLNLGAVEWDTRENVEENKRRFQAALSAPDLTLICLHQIHSDVVRSFEAVPAKQCKGDASATNRAGLLLGVRTADCAPVLVVDPNKCVVAAIHAGWRGTLQRIVTKTIGQMQMEFDCRPQDLLAAIGPTIGGCCYEVGTEVGSAFAAKFANASEFFDELRTGDEPNPLQWLNMMPPGHQPPPNKVLLDLKKANRLQLLEAGIREENIFVTELCTSCDVDRLFSYRKQGPASGRLMGVVGIRCSGAT